METEYSDVSSFKDIREKMSEDLADLGPPEPPADAFDLQVLRKPDQSLVEDLLQKLYAMDRVTSTKIEAIEHLDISHNILTFKVYEATHDFKAKIAEIKDERNQILVSVENRSELSLVLHDLDSKIIHLEEELDKKIADFNKQKIDFQHQIEQVMFELDDDISAMQETMKQLKKTLDAERGVAYRSQLLLINEKYNPHVEKLEKRLYQYERLQLSGWRLENSELKLASLLEEQGLQFTLSGRLLTKSGGLMTFEEAQEQGYFKKIHMSLQKVFDFFKDQGGPPRDLQAQPQLEPDSDIVSETTSVRSKLSSEDVKYLKQFVGKPLTFALAEITAKQPRDPIHYLGHYLFKYRYNQEVEEVEKREIDELTKERKRLAEQKWKEFVEAEARNAVMEMILRAEEIAYRNELRRIEEEQLAAEGEEEEQERDEELEAQLLEEAKDKFE